MEEYLQHFKSLRSQMNDVEQRVTEITVEQHKQQTAIRTAEKDLELVRAEVKRLDEDIDRILKEKGQVSSAILAEHKKFIKLEADSSALSQALEFLRQETAKHSNALGDKRSYYEKFKCEINNKLQEHQSHYESRKLEIELGKVEQRIEMTRSAVEAMSEDRTDDSEGRDMNVEAQEKYTNVLDRLNSAQIELDSLMDDSFVDLCSDNCQMKLAVEDLQSKCKELPEDLNNMDFMALEEELKALLSDKAGEEEYLRSLMDRIDQLKAISQTVKCDSCGGQYKVELIEGCNSPNSMS